MGSAWGDGDDSNPYYHQAPPNSVCEKKSRAEAHPLMFYSARYSCIISIAIDIITQISANTKLLFSMDRITKNPKANDAIAVNFFIQFVLMCMRFCLCPLNIF